MNSNRFKKFNKLLIPIFTVLFLSQFFIGVNFAMAGIYPIFNNDSQDLSTLRLKDRTRGDISWQESVTANAGDRIAFDIYYHNTVSGTVAENTKIRLDFEDNKNSQLRFKAFLSADNADYVSDLGYVNINCSEGLNITFDNKALWYPNQGTASQNISVTFVQTNSVLVNIGNIAGGWPAQGHVVFEGVISNPQPKFNFQSTDIKTLRLKDRTRQDTVWQNSISVNSGDRIAFDVYYRNGVQCSVAKNTKIKLLFPTSEQSSINTTAYISADNAVTVSDSATIALVVPEKLTFDDMALWYPRQSSVGQSISVSKTQNSVEVNIGDVGGSCEDQGHVVFEAVLTNTVQSPSVDIKANGYDSAITIPYNTSATLTWNSSNASYCYASQGWSGSKSISGSESTGNLTFSKTYTLTCTGAGGSVSDSVTVLVKTQESSTLSVYLAANPNTGCAPLNLVDMGATVLGTASGIVTYFFDCTNDGIWEKTYTAQDNYYTAYDLCNYSSAGTYTAKIRVERQGLTAENTAQINVNSCYLPLTLDIKANNSNGPINIPYNTSANLTWNSSNASYCYASQGWSGSKSISGSESTGNLTFSKTYTLTCQGAGGSVSDSVTVNVGTASTLAVQKWACNLSKGITCLESVSADPGDVISFSIQITTGGSSQNIVVKDTLPDKIVYRNNSLKIDGVYSTGNILSGLNIGILSPYQTKTITFYADISGPAYFNFGETQLTNSAIAYSPDASGSDTAKVIVTKKAVAGAATEVPTGLTNNPFFDSFLLPVVISLFIVLLFKSHIIQFEEWLDSRKKRYQEYRSKKLLQLKIAQVRIRALLQKKII